MLIALIDPVVYYNIYNSYLQYKQISFNTYAKINYKSNYFRNDNEHFYWEYVYSNEKDENDDAYNIMFNWIFWFPFSIYY